MNNKLIDIVVGARPNFIKIAALIKQFDIIMINESNLQYRLVHTSQHYDEKMSGIFFKELNIPNPHVNLNVGAIEISNQIPTIIARYSQVLREKKPDMVIVSGDVNSTLACALATKKTDPSIPLVHIEAGLRCGDRQMPEEINRILTDSISDFFFTTSITANENLINEGVLNEQIFFVGNTMIDTLFNNINRLHKPNFWTSNQLRPKRYYVLTLHRQGNITDFERLNHILQSVFEAVGNYPIVFPIHPHTAKKIQEFNIQLPSKCIVTEPLGYLEFNYLVKNATAVITDSGGISEETTIMNVPCMTMRDSTERPETCVIGTNFLLGNTAENIFQAFDILQSGNWQLGKYPELWDGNASVRIVDKVLKILSSSDENAVKVNKKVDLRHILEYKINYLN